VVVEEAVVTATTRSRPAAVDWTWPAVPADVDLAFDYPICAAVENTQAMESTAARAGGWSFQAARRRAIQAALSMAAVAPPLLQQ